jgi:hypothetical protein
VVHEKWLDDGPEFMGGHKYECMTVFLVPFAASAVPLARVLGTSIGWVTRKAFFSLLHSESSVDRWASARHLGIGSSWEIPRLARLYDIACRLGRSDETALLSKGL